MADAWGSWIEHDGGPCPVVGLLTQIEIESIMPTTLASLANLEVAGVAILRVDGVRVLIEMVAIDGLAWRHEYFGRMVDGQLCAKVVRYRVRRPDALQRLVELAADPGTVVPAVPEGVPA